MKWILFIIFVSGFSFAESMDQEFLELRQKRALIEKCLHEIDEQSAQNCEKLNELLYTEADQSAEGNESVSF